MNLRRLLVLKRQRGQDKEIKAMIYNALEGGFPFGYGQERTRKRASLS